MRCSTSPASPNEDQLIGATLAGDRRAFDKLLRPHLSPLRAYLYRLLCNPADADDVTQETLMQVYTRLAQFAGRSQFRTWLFSIATRKALDLLRARRTWPKDAQEQGEQVALSSKAVMEAIHEALNSAEADFDYRQHVSYCFSCVLRSLAPEESAALLLKEVFLFEGNQAARVMGLSESTFRHRLSAGREEMKQRFEGLCALVSKGGVCYQCAALRDLCHEDRRGPAPLPLAKDEDDRDTKLAIRLQVVRETDLEASKVHKVLLGFMSGLWDG